jgi:hypothetical protein
MSVANLMADLMITSFTLSPDGTSVEIQFLEAREQKRRASMARSMWIDYTDRPEVLARLQEYLRDMVDEGYVLIREPPEHMTGNANDIRQRMIEANEGRDAETE